VVRTTSQTPRDDKKSAVSWSLQQVELRFPAAQPVPLKFVFDKASNSFRHSSNDDATTTAATSAATPTRSTNDDPTSLLELRLLRQRLADSRLTTTVPMMLGGGALMLAWFRRSAPDPARQRAFARHFVRFLRDQPALRRELQLADESAGLGRGPFMHVHLRQTNIFRSGSPISSSAGASSVVLDQQYALASSGSGRFVVVDVRASPAAINNSNDPNAAATVASGWTRFLPAFARPKQQHWTVDHVQISMDGDVVWRQSRAGGDGGSKHIFTA
jgi:hypothetical protein